MKHPQYEEENGPRFLENHSYNYALIERCYPYGKRPDHAYNVWPDYIWLQQIQGVDYYTPNNEDWGDIIAIDHTNKLAINTSFYEMDDMAARNSEYNFTAYKGQLTPRFKQYD